MTAKEMFENLGYVQIIHEFDTGLYESCNGIQYLKEDPESEMERVGMMSTKCIEFYFMHKEIVIASKYKHRNGSESSGDAGILSLKEFEAIQKQVKELGWQTV